MSPRNWPLRVEDMLHAIAATQEYARALTFEAFAADQKTVDAVMHNITVLGEAARHVPDEVAGQYPEIPWDKMLAIRNVVVHMYFGVRKEILWQTIQDDLPLLIPHLEKMLQDTA